MQLLFDAGIETATGPPARGHQLSRRAYNFENFLARLTSNNLYFKDVLPLILKKMYQN